MTGYRSGHPWYYVRGGRVLRLKEIREAARASGYKGYRERDINAADCKDEPRRSEILRAMRMLALNNLHRDISCYRELKRRLFQYRRSLKSQFENGSPCKDIHVNISLKHNHMFNEFAHLIVIDELLSQQGDLFEMF